MNNTEEIWVPTCCADGYEVSNLGRVRSLKKGHPLLKQPYIRNKATQYYCVDLWSNNKGLKEYIHRLVATAFCERMEDHNEVDHIDGNRQNNVASNLRWVTTGQNLLNTKRRASLSGCRGIRWRTDRECWEVCVQLGHVRHRKNFKTMEEALAYREGLVDSLGISEFYNTER